jgi:hypothetical protein
MMQIAFAPQDDCVTDECQRAEGRPPWEFPMVAAEVEQSVASWVSKGDERRTIVEQASRFTLLQRLFRAALAGDLGQGFPRARLVGLMRVAKNADRVQVQATPIWDR